MIKASLICPTCYQSMGDAPMTGYGGHRCDQCGQGLRWKYAQTLRAKKRLKVAMKRKDRKDPKKSPRKHSRDKTAQGGRAAYRG